MNIMYLFNNIQFEILKIINWKGKELEGRHMYLVNIL
jgi:hypothetical protein